MTPLERFDRCLPLLLKDEGGYVDDKADPGGATNLGVTLATARAYNLDMDGDGDVDKLDVRALTSTAVRGVYHRGYWLAASCDKCPPGLDYMVFDCAVNQGVGRAVRWLQEAVGVDPDGVVGPKTLASIATAKPTQAALTMADLRGHHYRTRPHFPRFGKGWLARLERVEDQAVAWAAASKETA